MIFMKFQLAITAIAKAKLQLINDCLDWDDVIFNI